MVEKGDFSVREPDLTFHMTDYGGQKLANRAKWGRLTEDMRGDWWKCPSDIGKTWESGIARSRAERTPRGETAGKGDDRTEQWQGSLAQQEPERGPEQRRRNKV